MIYNDKYKKKRAFKQSQTVAVFNDFILESSDIFIHCYRIPDVMVRVAKAKEILKKYKIKAPAWMFGLTDKGETFDSPVHTRLMSFLISVGLYDRMVRLIGIPDFLIGSNQQSLLVSAKVSTFEKSVIKIFCGEQTKTSCLNLYQKIKNKKAKFSLSHFSKQCKTSTFKSVTNMYGINHCILICPSSKLVKIGGTPPQETQKAKTAYFTTESLIEMDSQLAWLWPILKRKQLAKSGKSFSYNNASFLNNISFH